MLRDDFEKMFWKQYLMLEKEFMETLNYVEFDISNFNTYSNKFAKLLLSIGSEMDNILRVVFSSQGRTKISDYANYVLNKYPGIIEQKVKTENNSIILKPFSGCNILRP